MNNIKNIYQHAGKCDDQQNIKDIIDAAILSTPEHRWELPGNYPIFTVVKVIYHYVDRIWRILVTPIFLYNIYDH